MQQLRCNDMADIRIIPRLDIKGPNLVKGLHFEGLRVLGAPEQYAQYYYENGADELIYMDIVASLYGRNSLLDIVEKTSKQIFIPLTVGGGLRSVEDITAVLCAGADKVSLNTAAIKNPELISQAANKFGSSTIVISIEAKKKLGGTYEAYVDNGRERTEVDAIGWAQQVEQLGAGEIMVTSIDQEGTGRGFDVDLIKEISTSVSIPVIGAGGAGSINDIVDVIQIAQVDAVNIGSILHYNYTNTLMKKSDSDNWAPWVEKMAVKFEDVNLKEIKKSLTESGIDCRYLENEGAPCQA